VSCLIRVVAVGLPTIGSRFATAQREALMHRFGAQPRRETLGEGSR